MANPTVDAHTEGLGGNKTTERKQMEAPKKKYLSYENIARRSFEAARLVSFDSLQGPDVDRVVDDVKYYLSLLAVGSADPKLLYARTPQARVTAWVDLSTEEKLPYFIFAGVVSGAHYAAWRAEDGFYIGGPDEQEEDPMPIEQENTIETGGQDVTEESDE